MITRPRWAAARRLRQSTPALCGVTPGMETRVFLRPGDKGTRKLAARFGKRLICVRYRYDAAAMFLLLVASFYGYMLSAAAACCLITSWAS